MKTSATKREWENAVRQAWTGSLTETAERLAAWLGAEFRPEEPEESDLPERIRKPALSCILIPEGPSPRVWEESVVRQRERIASEAAARYNAVSAMLSKFPDGWVAENVQRERERLR